MKRTAMTLAASALFASSMILTACQKVIHPPEAQGVCFHAVPRADGSITFNQLTAHEDTMEACAGSLEGMRQRFLGLGGNVHSIMGAYNGQYLFLDASGVYESQTYTGARFPFLVHTDDGRLAAPGAVQQ